MGTEIERNPCGPEAAAVKPRSCAAMSVQARRHAGFIALLDERRQSPACAGKTLYLAVEELGIHVFSRREGDGRIAMAGFCGKQKKPDFHYVFRGEEQALQWLDKWQENVRKTQAMRQERREQARAQSAQGHQLAAGDVLMTRWGYEQTNIDYYQVIRRVGRQSVELRQIGSQRQEDAPMQGECVPCKNNFIGKPLLRRVCLGSDGKSVRIDAVCLARRIEPVKAGGLEVYRPERWTSYA